MSSVPSTSATPSPISCSTNHGPKVCVAIPYCCSRYSPAYQDSGNVSTVTASTTSSAYSALCSVALPVMRATVSRIQAERRRPRNTHATASPYRNENSCSQ